MIGSILCASLANFQMGFNMAITSPALLYLSDSFPVFRDSPVLSGTAVSIIVFGAMLGAPIFARLADRVGRRPTLLLINAVYLAGCLLLTVSQWAWMIVVVRGMIGLAAGGSTAVVPVYFAEICPAAERGRYGVLIQFAVTSGILTAYLAGYGLSFIDLLPPWRLMFLAGALPALVFFSLNHWLLIESPRWCGDGFGDSSVDSGDCVAIDERNCHTKNTDNDLPSDSGRLVNNNINEGKPLLSNDELPKEDHEETAGSAMIAVIGLQLCQQFSGFNNIVYYSGIIFSDMGFKRRDALLASCVSTLPQLFILYGTSKLLDRLGRKPLMLFSMLSLSLCLFSVGLISWQLNDNLKYGLIKQIVSVVLILLARLSFSVGLGPVPAIWSPELLTSDVRAKAMGAASTVNWLANGMVTMSFLPLARLEQRYVWNDVGGDGGNLVLIYWVYVVFLLVGAWFVCKRVKETAGMELHDLARLA